MTAGSGGRPEIDFGQGSATESGHRMRLIVFVVLSVLVIGLAAGGLLNVDREVAVSQEEAIEIARPHVDFEPDRAEARLLRQGFRLQPIWGVSFSIPLDGNPRQFERHTTVEIDARTGNVIRVSVDEEGRRQLDDDDEGG